LGLVEEGVEVGASVAADPADLERDDFASFNEAA
jgi:hypothetical protein